MIFKTKNQIQKFLFRKFVKKFKLNFQSHHCQVNFAKNHRILLYKN